MKRERCRHSQVPCYTLLVLFHNTNKILSKPSVFFTEFLTLKRNFECLVETNKSNQLLLCEMLNKFPPWRASGSNALAEVYTIMELCWRESFLSDESIGSIYRTRGIESRPRGCMAMTVLLSLSVAFTFAVWWSLPRPWSGVTHTVADATKDCG